MPNDRRFLGHTRTRAQVARLDEVAAIIRIQEILSGSRWNSDTLEDIANVMTEAGYPPEGGDDNLPSPGLIYDED